MLRSYTFIQEIQFLVPYCVITLDLLHKCS